MTGGTKFAGRTFYARSDRTRLAAAGACGIAPAAEGAFRAAACSTPRLGRSVSPDRPGDFGLSFQSRTHVAPREALAARGVGEWRDRGGSGIRRRGRSLATARGASGQSSAHAAAAISRMGQDAARLADAISRFGDRLSRNQKFAGRRSAHDSPRPQIQCAAGRGSPCCPLMQSAERDSTL